MSENQGVVSAKQARSRETHQRLVASCVEQLREMTFDRVTIADIARGAGVSVGNFYRRFTSKEAILPDLYKEYDRRFAAFASDFGPASDDEPHDLREGVTRVVGAIARFLNENRGLVQALHLHARLHPEIIPVRSHDDRHGLYARFSELLPNAEPGRASLVGRTVGMLVVSALTEQIVYPEHTPAAAAAIQTDDFVDELVEVIVRYIDAD
jgi:AcrR family transcriptional regulator